MRWPLVWDPFKRRGTGWGAVAVRISGEAGATDVRTGDAGQGGSDDLHEVGFAREQAICVGMGATSSHRTVVYHADMAHVNPSVSAPLRVAIIGGGMFFDEIIGQTFKDLMRGGMAPALSSIGMSHFGPAMAHVPIEVVGVGTHRKTSGTADRIVRWFAEDFPDHSIQAYYGETVWREMIDALRPDILFVATPDHLHTQPILDALEAGCDVITEKPLCLTVEEVDRIVDAAKRAGRIVSVDLHKRYDPFVREMMVKARDEYGPINRVRAALEEPLEVSTEIFAWPEQSNPFAYVGCHWLDVVHHYLQVRPVSLFATGQRRLLAHWDEHHAVIAQRQGRSPDVYRTTGPIDTWDSMDVAVTYEDGMRGDYSNNWINPREFEGAVNQEIEVFGIYGRGFVDQQDRGFREAITGDGSRTRNPTFGGRIRHAGGEQEIFGYGKASIIAGLLAIARCRVLGTSAAELESTYPAASSQKSVVQVIEAAGAVAGRNEASRKAGRGTPVTARLAVDGGIEIIEP